MEDWRGSSMRRVANLTVALLSAVILQAQDRLKPAPEIQALVDAAPAAPPELAADILLCWYISFLKTSPMEQESPPEWLLHVKALFRLMDATPGHLEHVRAEVRKNGNLSMSLYAGLAALDAKRGGHPRE